MGTRCDVDDDGSAVGNDDEVGRYADRMHITSNIVDGNRCAVGVAVCAVQGTRCDGTDGSAVGDDDELGR